MFSLGSSCSLRRSREIPTTGRKTTVTKAKQPSRQKWHPNLAFQECKGLLAILYPEEESNSDQDRCVDPPTQEPPLILRPSRDIFVISWDGCLVSTTSRNIQWGLIAAYQVWPELEILTLDADLTWLYNKLRALQHVLAPPSVDNPHHPAVEYALAIRMLLEEQELDLGKSNGSQGKYGSKFHPSNKECPAFPQQTKEIKRKSRQQRPLTVGEIATNWRETLREAAWIRYAKEEGDGSNPLDLLQEAIDEEAKEQKTGRNDASKFNLQMQVRPDMVSLLQQQSEEASIIHVVGVYHQLDLCYAQKSLIQAGLNPVLCSGANEVMNAVSNNIFDTSQRIIPLITLNNARKSVEELLREAPRHSTVHVLESYWSKLLPLTPLFGYSVPRLPQHQHGNGSYRQKGNSMVGIGSCVVSDRKLQLCLCEWSQHCHPNDVAAATMNPWMTAW